MDFQINSYDLQSNNEASNIDYKVTSGSFLSDTASYFSSNESEEVNLEEYTSSNEQETQKRSLFHDEAMQILEDNNIEIDPNMGFTIAEENEDGYLFLINNGYGFCSAEIKKDGRIILNNMDVTNAKRRYISSIGIHIETKDGTWTFTNDGKTTFFGPNGEKYITEKQLSTMINYLDIFNIHRSIDNISLNPDGTLTYYDRDNDSQYDFDKDGRLTTFKHDDVTVDFDYTPPEEDLEHIRQLDEKVYGSGDYPLNFTATATIRGHKLKFYSIGDQGKKEATHYPIDAALNYSMYSDKILSILDNEFNGTVIGPWELSSAKNRETEKEGRIIKIGAYASSTGKYIFFPYDDADYICRSDHDTSLHEMGHIIDFYYRDKYEKGIKSYNTKIYELYDIYKELIPTLEYSGYKYPKYEESIDTYEFFADASSNYFLDPDTLKRYAPDLYDLLNDIYGEEDKYHYTYKEVIALD